MSEDRLTDGNVYRDGAVHICEEMCATCVFRPGNLMRLRPGRLRGMIEESQREETGIVCHRTIAGLGGSGENAICRGYFDRHARDVLTLRLALITGAIRFTPSPTSGRRRHE